MKVIIAGSRTFNDYALLKRIVDLFLSNVKDIEIVSGKAKGADTLGELYAKEKGYPVKEFYPDWTLGPAGGIMRNIEMAKYADTLIAFWDGRSRGTKHMIDFAKKLNKEVNVVPI